METLQFNRNNTFIQFSSGFRFIFVSKSGVLLIIFFFPTQYASRKRLSEPPVCVSTRNRQKLKRVLLYDPLLRNTLGVLTLSISCGIAQYVLLEFLPWPWTWLVKNSWPWTRVDEKRRVTTRPMGISMTSSDFQHLHSSEIDFGVNGERTHYSITTKR